MKKRNIFLISIVILISVFIGIKIYSEKEIEEDTKIPIKQEYIAPVDSKEIQKKEYPKTDVIKEYKNYTVCAKLEIPVIGLETYILEDYSIKALNILPTKFWGVNPNEIGNFCVAGHNFRNEKMFRNLKELSINDTMIVSDNNIGIVEYEVYDISTVSPDNTDCLSQETEGKREITLITCTVDSKKRIIVKAREIEN